MKKTQVWICHSTEEMNRRADELIAKGYEVEMETGVLPGQCFCLPIYRLLYRK